MFATVRQEKIKELLLQTKSIEIGALVKLLSVSEATIRRDLEKLEQQGFLCRIHGGAVLVEKKMPTEPDHSEENFEFQNKIGYLAAQLVEDNDIIFIGQGFVCGKLARHLKNKNGLTILTNSIEIINELKDFTNINVIGIGGNLKKRKNSLYFTGEMLNNTLAEISVNLAFMEVDGVDQDFGFSVVGMEEKRIWNVVRAISQEFIVLCESTKFNLKSMLKAGDLNCVSKLVTDHEIPESYIDYFYNEGIPVYTSYEMKHQEIANQG